MNATRYVGAVIAMLTLVHASDPAPKKIEVKKTTRQGSALLLEILVGNRETALECTTSQLTCRQLAPGYYMMVSLGKDGGVYQDCPNVDVFRQDADPKNDLPLGTYCFLGEQ